MANKENQDNPSGINHNSTGNGVLSRQPAKGGTGLGDRDGQPTSSLPWKIGCAAWWKKYIWEPQLRSDSHLCDVQITDESFAAKFVRDRRRLCAVLIPVIIVHFFWWCTAVKYNFFTLFAERYALVITMIFASFLSGLTSIGGGAIAFPVLTLILNVSPSIARDFSLLIQSAGMTSGSFTILFMQVSVEWYALLYGTIGGLLGLVVGLEFVEQQMSPALKKMVFSSFWFSFAASLFFLNFYRHRTTFTKIFFFSWWKGVILFCAGFVGGIFTSFVGSGLDICVLSILTLFFRLTEKTATPTAVILMAINSLVGLYWRRVIQGTLPIEAWKYMVVCVPVVVIGAPLGSLVGSHLRRLVLAFIINIILTVILVSSFVIIERTTMLTIISVVVIFVGGLMFLVLTLIGQRQLNHLEKQIVEYKKAGMTSETEVIIPHKNVSEKINDFDDVREVFISHL